MFDSLVAGGWSGGFKRRARGFIMSNSTAFVQKLWNYCNILRDGGFSYGDYEEQLTFLPFLEMAEEQARPPVNKSSPIPKSYGRREEPFFNHA
ncbi:MAG: hypothetical protein Q8M83_04215 [bacterium]|nr:hypothetical protein [bacterium]